MNNTPDEIANRAFELFSKQWNEKDHDYRLDDPRVRGQLMAIVTSAMVMLKECKPDVFERFVGGCEDVLSMVVPIKILRRLKPRPPNESAN